MLITHVMGMHVLSIGCLSVHCVSLFHLYFCATSAALYRCDNVLFFADPGYFLMRNETGFFELANADIPIVISTDLLTSCLDVL